MIYVKKSTTIDIGKNRKQIKMNMSIISKKNGFDKVVDINKWLILKRDAHNKYNVMMIKVVIDQLF
jgi:hypothetical protein